MATTAQIAQHPTFAFQPLREVENSAPKNKFQYLYFDLSKGYLSAVAATTCDCAAIAAKIFVLALPLICLLEGILDLIAFPFIWTANWLCRDAAEQAAPLPTPPLNVPIPTTVPLPAAARSPRPVAPPRTLSPRPVIVPIDIAPPRPKTPPAMLPAMLVEEPQAAPVDPEPVVAQPPVIHPDPPPAEIPLEAPPPQPEVREEPKFSAAPPISYSEFLSSKIPESVKERANYYVVQSRPVQWISNLFRSAAAE